MKKILLSGFVLSGILCANQLSYIPLNKAILSNENGGEKTAIEAYSDGIGIYTAGKFEIDNRAMNELVFSHGETAKKEGKTLKEFVLDNGSDKEKELAEKLGNLAENNKEEKVPCDDNDFFTTNDYLKDGECKGTFVNINKPYNNFVDSYPHNTTNWNTIIENKKYASTGQFSSKFFKLPDSGYLKIRASMTGSYLSVGITNKPNTNNWGNIHISGTFSSFSNYYGHHASLYTMPNGIYTFYIDLNNKKAFIERPNGSIIGNIFNIQEESYFGFSDDSSGGYGAIEILEVFSDIM